MKEQYIAPQVKELLFVPRENLTFTFDELEDLTQTPNEPGDATVISGTDILLPLN